FGYASNSVAYPSVASQFNIHFINGPATNDTLTAECQVVKNGKRAGVSEIKITNQENKLIAKATGTTIPVSVNNQDKYPKL
ncbi:MAG: PaaI family thioesterase, partial [Dehalococcoidales bacterium]|nr:PaaI family thioesterase [Dehalococcoidales bacterium]